MLGDAQYPPASVPAPNRLPRHRRRAPAQRPPPIPGFTRSALRLYLRVFNYVKSPTKPTSPGFPGLFSFGGKERGIKHRRTVVLCLAHSSPIGHLCITYYRTFPPVLWNEVPESMDPGPWGTAHLETHLATPNRLRGGRECRQRHAGPPRGDGARRGD